MKTKRNLLVLATLTLALGLGACGGSSSSSSLEPSSNVPTSTPSTSVTPSSEEDNYLPKLNKKEVTFHNQSEDYTFKNDKMTAYYYPNGNVPLVGIMDTIKDLDGYFINDMLKATFDQENETAHVSWEDEGYEFTLDVDCKNETLTVNSMVFFNFTNMPEGIDYGVHFQEVDGYQSEAQPIVFDLKPYNFDIFLRGDDVILPFNIFNTLFMQTNIGNILYNGEEFYFYGSYFEGEEEILPSRNQMIEGTKLPEDVLEARNNGLYFILDYFYGLKEVKGITSFKDYIENDPLLGKLINSTNPRENTIGFKEFFIRNLDDPHSGYSYKSFYNLPEGAYGYQVPLGLEDLGARYKRIIYLMNQLEYSYENEFGYYQLVRFEGNTAFLKFDQFLVGYDDELFLEDGTLKDNAWQYDTFYLMQKAFDEISKKPGIEHVVIDLSNNGGGVLAACYSALGFLTDEDIRIPMIDLVSKEQAVGKIQVDTDNDKDFTDLDAQSKYDYYILTSESTFSAANFFTSVCKDMGIAKIIGQRSGGGMCSVGECSLLDGTIFNISSNNCLSSAKLLEDETYEFSEIETGIAVDYELPIEKFYDLAYLNEMINTGFVDSNNK